MRFINFDNNFSMVFNVYDSLASKIKNFKNNKINFNCAISY